MHAARRIYVYLMSGIGLGALIAGLTMLLDVLLSQIGLGRSGEIIGGGGAPIREQLTVATALTAVSLPVWLIHWTLAERSVRPDRAAGLLELNAPERGLYFALVLGILLLVGAVAAASALQGAMLRTVGGGDFSDPAGDLSRAVVTLAAWAYHVRLRGRDWSRRTLTHQAAFLPRAYRFAAAFVGLFVMLFALTRLLDLAGRALLGVPSFGPVDGSPWWAYPLAEGVAGTLVGGAVWIGHWIHAGRLAAEPGPRGESERASSLRLAFFVAVFVVAAGGTLGFLGTGIGDGLELALGVETPGDGERIVSVLVALLGAAMFAAAWWIHARWLADEPVARASGAGAATVDRLRLYPVALVGLAFGAVGTAWLIGLTIDALFGPPAVAGDVMRTTELARFGPFALLGWLVWTWRWTSIARRSAADPAGEAASTTRRAMSLIALAASVVAGIVAGGAILYRAFGSLFGVELTGDPISELSLPIGALLVAVLVAVGHALLLRRDGRYRAGLEEEDGVARTATVVLRLSGPRDGIDAALAAIGSATPSGYALELAPERPAEG